MELRVCTIAHEKLILAQILIFLWELILDQNCVPWATISWDNQGLVLAQNWAFGETGFDPFFPTLKINSSASYSLQLYKRILSSHHTLPKLTYCFLWDHLASTKDNVGQTSSKEKKQQQQETSPPWWWPMTEHEPMRAKKNSPLTSGVHRSRETSPSDQCTASVRGRFLSSDQCTALVRAWGGSSPLTNVLYWSEGGCSPLTNAEHWLLTNAEHQLLTNAVPQSLTNTVHWLLTNVLHWSGGGSSPVTNAVHWSGGGSWEFSSGKSCTLVRGEVFFDQCTLSVRGTSSPLTNEVHHRRTSPFDWCITSVKGEGSLLRILSVECWCAGILFQKLWAYGMQFCVYQSLWESENWNLQKH
jgi:hypothetical protein